MGYKQPSSGLPFKQMGSSPAKQIKEIKGTSIFGKSPKDFVVAKNVTGYNAVRGIYDKISGSKTKLTNNKSSKNSVSKGASEAVPEAVTKGLVEGGKMGLMKKKGNLRPPEKKYMKVTKDVKMKPPYKKPVGPRAESSATPYASPAKQAEKKSNISSTKGSSVITNTDTGDTYDLKTGETVENKKGKKTYGYTKKMTKIKRTNPKGASINDFDGTRKQMYKGDADTKPR